MYLKTVNIHVTTNHDGVMYIQYQTKINTVISGFYYCSTTVQFLKDSLGEMIRM